jgi:hypothetical protein
MFAINTLENHNNDLTEHYEKIWDSAPAAEPVYNMIICEKTHNHGMVSEMPEFDWRPGKGYVEA